MREKCYLPTCLLSANWTISPVGDEIVDGDRAACDRHLARGVSRISRKHGAQPIAVTPRFVIQSPGDLGLLMPLVELGATFHGLISNTDTATALADRDGKTTGSHLTVLPAGGVVPRSALSQQDTLITLGGNDEGVTE